MTRKAGGWLGDSEKGGDSQEEGHKEPSGMAFREAKSRRNASRTGCLSRGCQDESSRPHRRPCRETGSRGPHRLIRPGSMP